VQNQIHEIWNQRFFSQIINSMADGVFTMDADGKITSWNRSMERISGYLASETLGKTCDILGCSRCFGRECPNGIQSCGIIKRGTSEAKECLVLHKDGHDVPVIKNASVVRDEEQHIIGVVETVTDLTELKQAKQVAKEAILRLKEVHQVENIIGKSHEINKVFSAIKVAAASESTILIQGESGTGKELVAAAIHYQSERKDGPLITVNCSALSESLLESELFGHVKGAFTGAARDRMGRFEEARNGTIFLDEIGELSPFIQVKLLRVLQEREVERVGDSKKRKINIRIITATHRDLIQQVRNGAFREDLYYRLKVFPIYLPPLRDRKEDIPLLVDYFINIMNQKTGKQVQGLSNAALRLLMDNSWAGNVRELENAIEHAFVLCDRKQIDAIDLPIEIRMHENLILSSETSSVATSTPTKTKKLTKDELLNLLEENQWNKSKIGRQIGLSHSSIWKYMKKWDIPLKR
jgi:two-component system, NtrC family, response regulator HydG